MGTADGAFDRDLFGEPIVAEAKKARPKGTVVQFPAKVSEPARASTTAEVPSSVPSGHQTTHTAISGSASVSSDGSKRAEFAYSHNSSGPARGFSLLPLFEWAIRQALRFPFKPVTASSAIVICLCTSPRAPQVVIHPSKAPPSFSLPRNAVPDLKKKRPAAKRAPRKTQTERDAEALDALRWQNGTRITPAPLPTSGRLRGEPSLAPH